MAYTLGNKCAKNLCKRIVLLQLIIENVVTCFFGTQCRWLIPRILLILQNTRFEKFSMCPSRNLFLDYTARNPGKLFLLCLLLSLAANIFEVV